MAGLAVPIVAGTAIRGVAATLMMRQVLQRHPNAFLITLAAFGVTIPLRRSQEFLRLDIRRGLEESGRDPSDPLVLVGHSQGGLAVLRLRHRSPGPGPARDQRGHSVVGSAQRRPA